MILSVSFFFFSLSLSRIRIDYQPALIYHRQCLQQQWSPSMPLINSTQPQHHNAITIITHDLIIVANSFHSHHVWLKEEIYWGIGDGVDRTHCHIWLMKTGYPHGFQGLHCIEKRSDTPDSFLNNHTIDIWLMKVLENALLLCRNSIIHKQCKIQATHKATTAASIATNATSNISNIALSSTATALDSTISS